MKKIYILLSRTNTVPARIIRRFIPGNFSHSSVSLYPCTNTFYSFARRKLHNPLVGGFISEDIHSFIFAKFPNTPCKVYSFEISDDAWMKARKNILFFKKHYRQATYSFAGMITSRMGFKLIRKYKFTCSSFVAHILNSTEEIKLPKAPCLMLPNDFLDCQGMKLEYEGMLGDCVIPVGGKHDYS